VSAGATLDFDATSSIALADATYTWDFGDGDGSGPATAAGEGQYASYGYEAAGVYPMKVWRTVRGSRVGISARQAARRERVPVTHGCLDDGYVRGTSRPTYYGYAVNVTSRNGQVDSLAAFGPHPLFC
jgi:PKD domain